jgi:hypothetical protein
MIGGAAAATALVPLSPGERFALGASLHDRGPATALDGTQLALVRELSDVIMPRTDTPGALDAGVPDFIERILAWWDTTEERDRFFRGLAAIETRLAGAAQRDEVLTALDSATSPAAGSAEEAWARLKSMVVYGYFTSKVVQEEVLRTVILPGRFDGCVPSGG